MCQYRPWEDDSAQIEDYEQRTRNNTGHVDTRLEARVALLEARMANVEARVERLEAKMFFLQKGMRIVCALFLVTLAYAQLQKSKRIRVFEDEEGNCRDQEVCGAMDAYHPHCLALSTTDWLSMENHQDSEHYRGRNVVRSTLKESIFKHNLQRKNEHPFPFKGSRTMGLKYFQLSIQGGILADMIISRFSCIGSYYLF
ncbi:hypothetical protein POTOM_021720 [Populus tomentosa]|uniref:Uncharacterized protein n=1 Tax=Populus tomentosa TaxID=118781 RepID=A0A8X8D1N9_POPTO|nr:hypothetical protein POTOM_021720 [Populus tomentosa]